MIPPSFCANVKKSRYNLLISVSASSNSLSISARSSYETGVSSNAAAIAAVVKANFWGMRRDTLRRSDGIELAPFVETDVVSLPLIRLSSAG